MVQHRLGIELAVQHFASKPSVAGVLLIGSVASGTANEGSDLDIILVVSVKSEFSRRAFVERLPELPLAQYLDVKVVDLAELASAPASADDPMRACLEGAQIIWARTPDVRKQIEDSVARTVVPGARYFRSLADAFIAEVALQATYFIPQAEKTGNNILLRTAAGKLAIAAGRLVLALNQKTYRGPKYLERQLNECASSPTDMVERLSKLLLYPNGADAKGIFIELCRLTKAVPTQEELLNRFIEDVEFAWLRGRERGNVVPLSAMLPTSAASSQAESS